MKKYIYYTDDGKIKMVAKSRLKTSRALNYISKDLSSAQIKKLLDNNNKREVINNKLTIEEPDDLESQIDKANSLPEMKKIIKKIISK